MNSLASVKISLKNINFYYRFERNNSKKSAETQFLLIERLGLSLYGWISHPHFERLEGKAKGMRVTAIINTLGSLLTFFSRFVSFFMLSKGILDDFAMNFRFQTLLFVVFGPESTSKVNIFSQKVYWGITPSDHTSYSFFRKIY